MLRKTFAPFQLYRSECDTDEKERLRRSEQTLKPEIERKNNTSPDTMNLIIGKILGLEVESAPEERE